MLVWILIALIVTVVGAAGAGTIAVVSGRRRLGGGPSPKALPDPDRGIERTLRELRVGDIVTYDGKDYVSEGVIAYDEDGHRWTGGRIVDGSDVRWLVIGLERSGSSIVRLTTEDSGSEIAGYPPEALVLGETRYALDKRGTATCKLDGDCGTLAAHTGGKKLVGTVERCRWWLYSAPGDDTAIVEQWGADFRILRGKKIGASTIDLMPGS